MTQTTFTTKEKNYLLEILRLKIECHKKNDTLMTGEREALCHSITIMITKVQALPVKLSPSPKSKPIRQYEEYKQKQIRAKARQHKTIIIKNGEIQCPTQKS